MSAMPLLAALDRLIQDKPYLMQTPGHKMGRGAPEDLLDRFGRATLCYDVCEGQELDDLHNPQGALAEAQAMLATHYGADASFFLVNGSTAGVQALLCTACGPKDALVLPRLAHRSAVSGLITAGARPVWAPIKWSCGWGLPLGMDVTATIDVLRSSRARAVLATNPSYWGGICDLSRLAVVCQDMNSTLIVDEAWGGHLHLLPDYASRTALAVGAAGCVQSAHKTLGALNQAAWLHSTGRLPLEELQEWLRIFQSSSPSYLLLASLDAARAQLASHGHALLKRAAALAQEIARTVANWPGFRVMDRADAQNEGIADLDPCRLVISALDGGWSGWKLASELLSAGVRCELAGPGSVLLLITMADDESILPKITPLFQRLSRRLESGEPDEHLSLARSLCLSPPPMPEVVMAPREAFLADASPCRLSQAAGKVSASLVAPMPPGLPLLCPGELITDDVIDYLARCGCQGEIRVLTGDGIVD
jgi:arginine decarboxylase